MELDWKSIAGTVAPLAPKLGSVLGASFGPLGSIIGGLAGNALAAAFGTDATPEAVGKAIAEDPQAKEKIQAVEAEQGQDILAQAHAEVEKERLRQETEQRRISAEDTQNARTYQTALVNAGSPISWASVVVSAVIIAGFITISFLAMKPEMAGVDKSVTLYLLGAWQSLATMAAGYWLGSSVGSKDKDAAMQSLFSQAVAKPNPSPGTVEMVKAAAKGGKK